MSQKNQNFYHPVNQIKLTASQRAADKVTAFLGSWKFIIILFSCLFVWVIINLFAYFLRWDPYPFILLNLCLSCIAALQAPVILMSQNREAEIDRQRSEHDYQVDCKAEHEVEDLQKDLEIIKEMIRELKK